MFSGFGAAAGDDSDIKAPWEKRGETLADFDKQVKVAPPTDLNHRPGPAKLPRRQPKNRRGCSSVVERHVANVNVEGSTPFTRFERKSRRTLYQAYLFNGEQRGRRRPEKR